MQIQVKVENEKKGILSTNFILIFFGKLASQIGDSIYNIAIGWFILSFTGSAFQMAIYMVIGTLTYVICCPFGGVISDKVKRKRLIVYLDIIRGVTVAVVGIMMYFGIVSIWMFYIASVILSVCGALFVPASNALIPLIVKEESLTRANSAISTVNSISSILGLIMGGVLYQMIGIQGIFILNSVSYILSGISEMFIKLTENGISFIEIEFKMNHFVKDFKDGFAEFNENKGMMKLVWSASLINLVATPLFAIFIPYMFNQVIHSIPVHLAYVNAAFAVGGIIGAVILSILPQREKVFRNIFIGFASDCVLCIGMFFVFRAYMVGDILYFGFLVVMVIVGGLIGMASSIMNIPLMGLLQKSISNENLGKVFSMINTIAMCSMPIGLMIGGILADMLPIHIATLIMVLPQILITGYVVKQKDIRAL